MHQQTTIMQALRQSIVEMDARRDFSDGEQSRERLCFGLPFIDTLLGGGLACNEMHEIRCSFSRDIGSAYGLVCALLARFRQNRRVVWISEPSSVADCGMLFPDGLSFFGLDASRVITLRPLDLREAFWAAGETARYGGLAAVVFQVKGNPKNFDLSISRKLMLRAQTGKTLLFILRQAGMQEASSATTRWHVEPAPSLADHNYRQGLGNMRLTLSLERNRNGQTGRWAVAWNPKTRSFEHAVQGASTTHSGVSLSPSSHRQHHPPAAGKILANRWQGRRAS